MYNSHLVTKEFNMEISTTKTETMAYQGKEPIRSKICTENTISEQVNNFNYLVYNFRNKEEINIEKKLAKFNIALRIINHVFHPAKV
jgi:hypothetical protein